MVKSREASKRQRVLYEVEVFTKARIVHDDQGKGREDGKSIEYFVKWAGYDSSENSWEPESGLVGCERLVAGFWKHLSIPNPYCCKVGTELKALPPWIKKEKELFAQSMQEENVKNDTLLKKRSENTKPIVIPKSQLSVPLPQRPKRKKMFQDEPEDSTSPLSTVVVNRRKNDEQALTKTTEAECLFEGAPNKEFEDMPSPSSSSSLFHGSPERLLPEKHDHMAVDDPPTSTSPKVPFVQAIISDRVPRLPVQKKHPSTMFLSSSRLNELPSHHSPSTHMASGLSTKQILSQGALVPTLIKNIVSSSPQKCSWAGPLELRHHTGATQSRTMQFICNIGLFKKTTPKFKRLEMANILSELKKVQLMSFHDVEDFYIISQSCKPPCQFGQFGPRTPRDAALFSLVIKMMTRARKVALLPLTSHGHLIGHIIFLPEALQANIHNFLQVPSNFNEVTGESLTAAIILWTLPHRTPYLSPFKKFPQRLITDVPKIKHQEIFLQARKKLILAIQMLGFPHKLYEFFHDTVKDRTFSIWWKTLNDSEASALETSRLQDILETTYARHVGYEKNARVIFVHVSSLETIHMIPKLVNRRQGYPRRVQFYTYGTSEAIPKVLWGIREIYPCGGVVTFTPCAFLKNPLQVMDTLRKIHKHPLWISYILPQALGMLAKLSCMVGDGDPLILKKYDDLHFPYTWVLKAIEEGVVALLTSPQKVNDGWIQDFFKLQPPSARDALEIAIGGLEAKFKNAPVFQWNGLIEKAIESDLKEMQKELGIMMEYRRYVIITSDEDHKLRQSEIGVEWVNISKFKFEDDFYLK